MNTKTVFISECERDHILSGLRTGLQVGLKDYSEADTSQDLFIVLDKLGLLDKNLKNMERSDIMKYECLRKKMKEVRCNAKQLLQSDDISMEEMRTIIKNLNQISRKMKEMSKKLGSVDQLSDSDTSYHSSNSFDKKKKVPESKKKTQCVSTNVGSKAKCAKYEDAKNNSKVVCKSPKQKPNTSQCKNREETKCVSRSRIADIFSDQDCLTQSDLRPKEPSNIKGNYITKYSKSNDHQYHCYDGLVVETCSKCLCRRWSIPSVNRNSLKTYIKKNIKNTGHRAAANIECVHSFCRSRPLCKKDDFVALPGLVPHERKHLTAVRNKILKENACNSGSDLLNKNSSTGCCFISNTDLEVFETSDTSLNKNDDTFMGNTWDEIFDSCSTEYKGGTHHFENKNVPVPMADGAIQWDGERSQVNFISSAIKLGYCREEEKEESPIDFYACQSNEKVIATKYPANEKFIATKCQSNEKPMTTKCQSNEKPMTTKCQSNEKPMTTKCQSNEKPMTTKCQSNEKPMTTKCQSNEKPLTKKKKWVERLDKSIQSTCSKVNQSTSYDNFVLHPQFSWSMPMIGQAFRRSIPLAKEKWQYLDKRGKFVRPSKPSMDTGTATKKPRNIMVMDRSVQTNDMLFTKNMHQVMYLNVVYTKTHLRYIIPNSMEVPVLPQTPKVIERRAIDNGYAVTTYKADPDGVIHFTLAYSDGEECRTDGSGLTSEANGRLSQLKNLWISSARKFFSQLNEKLVGNSEDFEKNNRWTNSFNYSSTYTSSSITQSETSDTSTKTNDTDC